MKIKIRKILMSILLLVSTQQYVYADLGGTDVDKVCQVSAPCPAGQSGSISIQIVGHNHMACVGVPWNNGVTITLDILAAGGNLNDVSYKLNKQFGGRVMSSSSSCVNNAPTYKSTQTETQTLACPSAQPSGTWTQTRTSELWSDGSVRNPTAWVDVTKTCKAIISVTGTNQRALNCPAGQTGSITQSRPYQLWTDGTIVYTSGWSVISNTCKVNDIAGNPAQRVEACPEGYIGKKTYKWITQYKDVIYNATDTEGNPITYTLSTPYLQEVLDTNTCTLIPTTQTVSNDTSQSVSCDSYYGVPVGTYSGTVIKYGKNVTTYSSLTQTTSTVFTPSGNNDVTGCSASSSAVEYKDGVCPDGQSGTQVLYSYVTTVNGVKNYSAWSVFSSTCKVPDVNDVNTPSTFKTSSSIISNMALTSSNLINKNDYNTFLQNLKSSNFAANENHALNIVIDDASKNVYNPAKLTSAVNAFKEAVGANYSQIKIVSVPKDLSKYIGYNGLTDMANKSFKSATVDSNNIIVLEYLDLSQKDGNGLPKTQTVNIPIFTSSMGSSVKFNDK